MASLYRGWVSGIAAGMVKVRVDLDSCKRRLKLSKAKRMNQDAVQVEDVFEGRIVLHVEPHEADRDLPAGLYLLRETGADPEVANVMLTCDEVQAL